MTTSNKTPVDVDALRQFVGGTVEGEIHRTTDNALLNKIFAGNVSAVEESSGKLHLVIDCDGSEDHRWLPLHAAWSERSGDSLIVFVPGFGPTIRQVTFSPPK